MDEHPLPLSTSRCASVACAAQAQNVAASYVPMEMWDTTHCAANMEDVSIATHAVWAQSLDNQHHEEKHTHGRRCQTHARDHGFGDPPCGFHIGEEGTVQSLELKLMGKVGWEEQIIHSSSVSWNTETQLRSICSTGGRPDPLHSAFAGQPPCTASRSRHADLGWVHRWNLFAAHFETSRALWAADSSSCGDRESDCSAAPRKPIIACGCETWDCKTAKCTRTLLTKT